MTTAQATDWSNRDSSVLHAVLLTPWATAEQLRQIRRLKYSEWGVRQSLAGLIAGDLIYVVPYRGIHASSRANLHHISAKGVSVLEELRGWDDERVYRDFMASRQWQRQLVRHLDVVQLAYGLGTELADITGEDEPLAYYFPRRGSFDALVFQDFTRGLSVGIIRKGPLLSEQRLFARLQSIQNGDKLLNFHERYGGRRGPGVILIVVQTAFEKDSVVRLFQPLGKLWLSDLETAVATEEEAQAGLYTVCRNEKVVIDAGRIAAFKPSPSTFEPKVPPYRHHPPISADKLPPLLAPVQRRMIDALFRWPLMRPTEVACTIGTGYAGRCTGYLHELRDLGLLKNVRDLETEGLISYDPQEYRNLPLLLSDKGLRFLAVRDRTRAGDVLNAWGTEKVNPETGKSEMGGSIRKLISELHHTLGVNALVAKICSELPYVPDVLPDHLSRRYYKADRWTKGEWRPSTSVAPDAAILLQKDEYQRTILLEFERQATRGGKALTRKLEVWSNYFRHSQRGGLDAYVGLEVVAFVVPTEKSKDLLAARWQWLMRRNVFLRRDHLPLFVTTEQDLKDGSALNDPVWTLAAAPERGEIHLNFD